MIKSSWDHGKLLKNAGVEYQKVQNVFKVQFKLDNSI